MDVLVPLARIQLLSLLPILLLNHLGPFFYRFAIAIISFFEHNPPPAETETVDAGGNEQVIREPPPLSSSDSERLRNANAPGDTVRSGSKQAPSDAPSPNLPLDIHPVCETKNPFHSISSKGNTCDIFAKKKEFSRAWFVYGDIELGVAEGDIMIIFQSGGFRHRGSVYIQLQKEANRQEGEERSFPFGMDHRQTSRAQLVANADTSDTATSVAIGATFGATITEVPINNLNLWQHMHKTRCNSLGYLELAQMGATNLERFQQEGNMILIEESINLSMTAINLALPKDPEVPKIWNSLGSAYGYRFNQLGNIDDLHSAIAHHQRAVALTPESHPNLSSFLKSLANSCQILFEQTGNLDDLHVAIAHHQHSVNVTPENHPSLSGLLNNLANSHMSLFRHTGNLDDLNFAVAHHQRAVDLTPENHPNCLKQLNNLASSCQSLFEQTGNLNDLHFAIAYHQRAVDLMPENHTDFPKQLSSLAISHRTLFEQTGNLEDLHLAIAQHQQAVNLTPEQHPEFPSRLSNLASSHRILFEQSGELDDLHVAITIHQRAIDLTPGNHTDFPRQLNDQAISHRIMFEQAGNLDDLHFAIALHHCAISLTPENHSDLPNRLNALARSRQILFEQTGDLENLHFAISQYQHAMDLTPENHSNIPTFLNNLASSHLTLFEQTGNMDNLHFAIAQHQQAVNLTPEKHPGLPSRLANLASSHQTLFEQTGNLNDLHFAISQHQRAVNLTPEKHPGLPSRLANLASSLRTLFEQTENLNDLHVAIAHHQRAVDLTPENHPDLPSRLNDLGSSHQTLFEQNRNSDDLHLAIAYHQRAVDLTPERHYNLSKRLNSLAISHQTLFEQTGNLNDLHFAIAHHQRAVDLTPKKHPNLPSRLNNLASSRQNLFEKTGDLKHLLLVTAHRQQALDLTPASHADLVDYLYHLGQAQYAQYESFGNAAGLQASNLLFRRAAQTSAAPHRRVLSAYFAAVTSSILDSGGVLHDCEVAVGVFLQAGGLDQVIHRRHTLIGRIQSPISFAAVHAIICNQESLAFEWLNQGRCLVWNQIQQLRHPLDDLRTLHPQLAKEFYIASKDLELFGARTNNPWSDTPFNVKNLQQSDAARHHELWQKYTSLLLRIRTKDGFANYLLPPKLDRLVALLPPDGPIILFNINELRCDALALLPTSSKPILIPLPDYGETEALRSKRQIMTLLELGYRGESDEGDRGSRIGTLHSRSWTKILERLYRQIIEPVFKALDLLDNPPASPSERRRIWWCPTGPLCFLPLHAAGIYQSSSPVCVSDFVISSYAPSAGLLGDLFRRRRSSSTPNVLIVSQPSAPGLSPIPGVKEEADQVHKSLSESGIPVRLLENAAATTATVKSELATHSWVHFASHGIQDVEDPMKSGLYMHDGRLELIDLIRQRIPNTDFAYLSACQTGKGDEKLSDEVVHIVAGLLAIGYRGVVGTMWSISDRAAPRFASEFYGYFLEKKHFESSQAAFALDHSIRKYREAHGDSEESLLNWVPYVHYGY